MPLDRDRLSHVRDTPDGGCTAQCPICASEGGDSRGVHLRLWPDGRFACVAHPGDSYHRRQIWAVAGDASKPGLAFVKVLCAEEARKQRSRHAAKLLEDIEPLRRRVFEKPWPPDAIPESSPASIPTAFDGQAICILGLFPPTDVVWTGFLHSSGSPCHANNFRPALEWFLSEQRPPGPRICPCTFKPGSFSRSQANLLTWRFLVVEADTLEIEDQGAILRWLSERLRLRAIVHSGGRSLHGWFDLPGKKDLADLRVLLPALGTDPALFNPVQPVRLPGWRRSDNGNVPTLLYLDPP